MNEEPLLRQINNSGHPILDIVDVNHGNRGELFIEHRWDLTDLQDDYARATLANIHSLWTRPVFLQTQKDGRVIRYRADAEGVTQEDA